MTGRALDRLYEQDVTSVYALVSREAVKRLGLRPRCGHLDSTSFHVDGQYTSEHEPEAGSFTSRQDTAATIGLI